ncbi:MAG: hypothetical protein ABJB85_07900 [Nitrososphaerota archaeon]
MNNLKLDEALYRIGQVEPTPEPAPDNPDLVMMTMKTLPLYNFHLIAFVGRIQ